MEASSNSGTRRQTAEVAGKGSPFWGPVAKRPSNHSGTNTINTASKP